MGVEDGAVTAPLCAVSCPSAVSSATAWKPTSVRDGEPGTVTRTVEAKRGHQLPDGPSSRSRFLEKVEAPFAADSAIGRRGWASVARREGFEPSTLRSEV